mgnify:CR=1 FL=1
MRTFAYRSWISGNSHACRLAGVLWKYHFSNRSKIAASSLSTLHKSLPLRRIRWQLGLASLHAFKNLPQPFVCLVPSSLVLLVSHVVFPLSELSPPHTTFQPMELRQNFADSLRDSGSSVCFEQTCQPFGKLFQCPANSHMMRSAMVPGKNFHQGNSGTERHVLYCAAITGGVAKHIPHGPAKH